MCKFVITLIIRIAIHKFNRIYCSMFVYYRKRATTKQRALFAISKADSAVTGRIERIEQIGLCRRLGELVGYLLAPS